MDEQEYSNDERCIDCGACCMWMTVPPTIGDDDDDDWWDCLPDELKIEINAVEGAMKPCVWLDMETRRCKHYDLRPPTCRLFKPGCQVCEEDRMRLLTIY